MADGTVRKKGMDTKEGMEGENIRMARGRGMEILQEINEIKRRERNQGVELQEVRDTFVVLTNSSDSPLLPGTREDYTSVTL